jgi:hypothetical protein
MEGLERMVHSSIDGAVVVAESSALKRFREDPDGHVMQVEK